MVVLTCVQNRTSAPVLRIASDFEVEGSWMNWRSNWYWARQV